MSIENPTLAHFRHFSSLLTNEIRSTKDYVRSYKLFLQNEPKFRKSQMSLSDLLIREYEQMDTWSIGKNEPKTNPNEPKTNPIKANKMPKQTQFKPKQTQSPRPNYGKPPCTPGEDTLQKPGCIFKTYCYIDDQWNSASPPGFTNVNGWISIFSFQGNIITGETS